MSLLTDDLRSMIGREARYTAPEELGRAAIRYFALAVGAGDPIHTDPAAARAAGHADVVAPPTLICETNQYAGLPPDADGYAGHGWGLRVPGTRLIRGGNRYTFGRPVRPDDVVTVVWRLEDITERVTGGGAPMLVVTSSATYTAADGDLLAVNTETLIHLGEAPADNDAPADDEEAA